MMRTVLRAVTHSNNCLRNFHVTALSRLREIVVEKKNETTTVIDCKYVKSPRAPYLLKIKEKEKSHKCSLCKLQLQLKYTDVLILSQFLDCKGNVMERQNTDLCKDQYKLVRELIYMAQHAGLLPEPHSDTPKKPYQLLNTYYDEATINLYKKPIKYEKRFFYLKRNLAPIEKVRVKPDVGSYYGPKVH